MSGKISRRIRLESARVIDSPYLTSHEAVDYLRLPSLSSLYSHMRENGLPFGRVGGSLRFDKRDLDAWVHGTTAIDLARERQHKKEKRR